MSGFVDKVAWHEAIKYIGEPDDEFKKYHLAEWELLDFVAEYEAAKGDGWRPIESAPKDSTEVRVGLFLNWGSESRSDDEKRVGCGFYDAGAYWYDNTTKVWRNRIAQFLKEPTHWKPLDNPPSEA